MKKTSVFPQALVLLLLLTLCLNSPAFSQLSPLTVGEFYIWGENGASLPITVTAVSTIHGKKSDGFPLVTGQWNYYTAQGGLTLDHVDRSGYLHPVIGYAKYKVELGNDKFFFVDYRDADFTLPLGQPWAYTTNEDLEFSYTVGGTIYHYPALGNKLPMANGATLGWWEDGHKPVPYAQPRIPVTVQCYYNSGYSGTVVIDQVSQSSPCQTVWTLGNHLISAPSPQGGSWFFDHWSDGGAQSHTVSATLDNFAVTYTAYYHRDLRLTQDELTTLTSYPNPCNPVSTISYSIPEQGYVRLVITDILGRIIALPVDGIEEAGIHHALFDGGRLASGIYYCRLQVGSRMQFLRLLLVK